MNQKQATICEAIKTKHLIRLFYTEGYRTVEPHCLGEAKTGNILLRAFQIRGSSKSLEFKGWKLFNIDEIISLSIHDDCFERPRHGYNPNDPEFVRIICRL